MRHGDDDDDHDYEKDWLEEAMQDVATRSLAFVPSNSSDERTCCAVWSGADA